jgi:hypothetical protein
MIDDLLLRRDCHGLNDRPRNDDKNHLQPKKSTPINGRCILSYTTVDLRVDIGGLRAYNFL